MSDQQPATPPNPDDFPLGYLIGLGIILLLPGLCSLCVVGDNSLLVVWVPGLLVGALGVALLTFAIRRLRRS